MTRRSALLMSSSLALRRSPSRSRRARRTPQAIRRALVLRQNRHGRPVPPGRRTRPLRHRPGEGSRTGPPARSTAWCPPSSPAPAAFRSAGTARRTTTSSRRTCATTSPKPPPPKLPNVITFSGNRRGHGRRRGPRQLHPRPQARRQSRRGRRRHHLPGTAQQQGGPQGLPVRPHRVGRRSGARRSGRRA